MVAKKPFKIKISQVIFFGSTSNNNVDNIC